MKMNKSNHYSRLFSLTAVLLAISATARSADMPALKDVYKKHFQVGAAINRTIATGAAVQADKDVALVKQQFNQISPENDLKWSLIHPRPGMDGYNFGRPTPT